MSEENTYRLFIIREFDPDDASLPPGDVEDALEYAAEHKGSSGETWELVDDVGNVIHRYEV
jgi:hypothetical protein